MSTTSSSSQLRCAAGSQFGNFQKKFLETYRRLGSGGFVNKVPGSISFAMVEIVPSNIIYASLLVLSEEMGENNTIAWFSSDQIFLANKNQHQRFWTKLKQRIILTNFRNLCKWIKYCIHTSQQIIKSFKGAFDNCINWKMINKVVHYNISKYQT